MWVCGSHFVAGMLDFWVNSSFFWEQLKNFPKQLSIGLCFLFACVSLCVSSSSGVCLQTCSSVEASQANASSRSIRPCSPFVGRGSGHLLIMCCAVCLMSPHSQKALSIRPHFFSAVLQHPLPVLRPLRVVHCFLRRSQLGISIGSLMYKCSLDGFADSAGLSFLP